MERHALLGLRSRGEEEALRLQDTLALALLGGILLASSALACGARSSFIDQLALGEGGAGGTPGPGTGTGTGTGTTTTTSTTTTTGTGTTTMPPICDDQTNTCEECQQCAVDGPCADEIAACNASDQCVSLLNCLIDCESACLNDPDPEGCYDECALAPGGCTDQFPGGIDDLNALLDCVFLEQCPNECN
jgi:hypothetical protein